MGLSLKGVYCAVRGGEHVYNGEGLNSARGARSEALVGNTFTFALMVDSVDEAS